MIATDTVIDGELIELPPEAGDITAAHFEPNDDWVREANPAEQQTAMWHWFANRYDEPAESTPHDADGHYDYLNGGPYHPRDVLRERFKDCVPEDVIDYFAERVSAAGGNDWAPRGIDKAGG